MECKNVEVAALIPSLRFDDADRSTIVALIVKHWFAKLDKDEKAALKKWTRARPENKAAFEAATSPTSMLKAMEELFPSLAVDKEPTELSRP